jgi:enoyl-CoA hydratase
MSFDRTDIDRRNADAGSHRDFDTLRYETPAPGVARIVLDRPQARNAQNLALLYELNAAFDRAVADGGVRAIVLAASGPHFSSGHDLRERLGPAVPRPATVGTWSDFDAAGAHGRYAHEQEVYLQLTRRWRELSKPTLAAVQGKCIAGGLMLAWPCDLIVASDDASFADPVVSFGVGGVEWFHHVHEVGMRKAKEMLFTSEAIGAAEALQLGMVNKVVPRAELQEAAMEMARKIATKSRFALKMTKLALNGVADAAGRDIAMRNAFHLHQLAHTHNLKVFGMLMDPSALPEATRKAMAARAAAQE